MLNCSESVALKFGASRNSPDLSAGLPTIRRASRVILSLPATDEAYVPSQCDRERPRASRPRDVQSPSLIPRSSDDESRGIASAEYSAKIIRVEVRIDADRIVLINDGL